MTRAVYSEDLSTPPTLLDGVSWPGLALLLIGDAVLVWALDEGGSGGWALAGIAAITLLIGLTWITLEHNRFRNRVSRRSKARPDISPARPPRTVKDVSGSPSRVP